jgi:hypothetical protein
MIGRKYPNRARNHRDIENPMFGRKHTLETREKMRKARLDKKFPRKPKELIIVSEDAVNQLSELLIEEINKTRNDLPVTFDEFGKPQ